MSLPQVLAGMTQHDIAVDLAGKDWTRGIIVSTSDGPAAAYQVGIVVVTYTNGTLTIHPHADEETAVVCWQRAAMIVGMSGTILSMTDPSLASPEPVSDQAAPDAVDHASMWPTA